MSRFQTLLHIELPPYLAQWYVHANGGKHPILLDSSSTEYKMIRTRLVEKPSVAFEPDISKSHVSIILSEIEIFEDVPMDYLPRGDREELAEYIRDRFIGDFIPFMTKGRKKRSRTDRRIEAFMETHGIEFTDTNWNSLAKIFQRQQANDRMRKYRTKEKFGKKRSKKQ